MLIKKILAVTVSFCLCAALSAQAAPKKVLTARDVDNFAANYTAMNVDFDALGDKFDNLIEPGTDGESLGLAIARARSTKAPPEIQAILKKYGYDDNGFEKIMVITFGCSALAMESAMNEQLQDVQMTPEMKVYLDSAKLQVSQMKGAIHPDDLALIQKRQDDIVALLSSGSAQ